MKKKPFQKKVSFLAFMGLCLLLLGVLWLVQKSPFAKKEAVKVQLVFHGKPLVLRTVVFQQIEHMVSKKSFFEIHTQVLRNKLFQTSLYKKVFVQKRMPNTLFVQVWFRKPIGIFLKLAQPKSLKILDEEGKFLKKNFFQKIPDLPLVWFPTEKSQDGARLILQFLKWSFFYLSDLSWNDSKGWVLHGKFIDKKKEIISRMGIFLGRDFYEIQKRLIYLKKVFQFLKWRKIKAYLIWVQKKKIVVSFSDHEGKKTILKKMSKI